MTICYTLKLVNKKASLDLRQKHAAIKDALGRLETDERTDRRSQHLKRCSIRSIGPRNVEIEVDESSNRWHPCVGSMLANHYRMRHYCSGSRLFRWRSN